MTNRTDLLNFIAKLIAAKTYLEIGLYDTSRNFDKIKVAKKTGVDPKIKAWEGSILSVTSDEFFAKNTKKFDLIFIDGDHSYEQSKRDLANSIKALATDGFIVMHDCNPRTASAALPRKPSGGGAWNGEVYRTFYEQNCKPGLLAFVCDLDHGLGIITNRCSNVMRPALLGDLPFKKFITNRDDYLSLTSVAATLGTLIKLCTPASDKS